MTIHRAKITPEREAKLDMAKKAMIAHLEPWVEQFDISAEEALCLLAYMVGGALALQDQRTMTLADGMELIARNIEAGNITAIDTLLMAKGGRA